MTSSLASSACAAWHAFDRTWLAGLGFVDLRGSRLAISPNPLKSIETMTVRPSFGGPSRLGIRLGMALLELRSLGITLRAVSGLKHAS